MAVVSGLWGLSSSVTADVAPGFVFEEGGVAVTVGCAANGWGGCAGVVKPRLAAEKVAEDIRAGTTVVGGVKNEPSSRVSKKSLPRYSVTRVKCGGWKHLRQDRKFVSECFWIDKGRLCAC